MSNKNDLDEINKQIEKELLESLNEPRDSNCKKEKKFTSFQFWGTMLLTIFMLLNIIKIFSLISDFINVDRPHLTRQLL